MFTHHCYTCMYFSIFLSYGSPFILHVYSVFLLHDYFSLLIFPLLDTWVIDMWCVKLSATWIQATGTTSRIPHLLFPVSRYLVICYQQSSGHVIMLHVPCIILVLAMQCTLNIITITWGWGRLDSWLGLVGWMSGSIVSPTAGDVVGLATICIVLFLLLP